MRIAHLKPRMWLTKVLKCAEVLRISKKEKEVHADLGKRNVFRCSMMKQVYDTPKMEKVELSTEDIVTTSQLENAGSLENWENVGKPTWGNGGSW